MGKRKSPLGISAFCTITAMGAFGFIAAELEMKRL
jgi:hypothetical protein